MPPLIQNCPKYSFTRSLPLSFLFARPPPETVSFHHSTWFHTPRPNIKVDMNRNEKHRIVFPQTIVSTAVICVMLSTGVSRPISLWAAFLPACCLSIRPSTLSTTAVFLSLSLCTRGQSLCFSTGHLTCRVLPWWLITWSLSTPRCAHTHTRIQLKKQTCALAEEMLIHTYPDVNDKIFKY